MTKNDESGVLLSPSEPKSLAVVDGHLFSSAVERPTRKKPRRAPQKALPIQPGDPACWAWPAFNFGPGLKSVESAIRALRAWHKGRCGICGEVPRLLVVDHDHQTSLVRGLLCDDCNLREGVARAKDDAFARWRAVPSAAILGIVVVYASSQTGVADPQPFKVTGPPFLPEWAPPHHPWPPREALRVDQAPGYAGRPRPRSQPQAAPPPEPAPTAASSSWPVQVGEEVALGLREHVHGVAECRIGVVEAVTQFGVRLAMRTRGSRWSQTIRWEAIEEIVHAPLLDAEELEDCGYPPDAKETDPGPLYSVAHEWNLSPAARRQELERYRAVRRERKDRMARTGHHRHPGYL